MHNILFITWFDARYLRAVFRFSRTSILATFLLKHVLVYEL
jgi:hypothetical protein